MDLVGIEKALQAASGSDASKYIGRCNEAAIIAFAHLADIGLPDGLRPFMAAGNYHGLLDQAAKELFGDRPYCGHCWVVIGDKHGNVVAHLDPTQWVFSFETQQPSIALCQADDARYQLTTKTDRWQTYFIEYLQSMGYDTSALPELAETVLR